MRTFLEQNITVNNQECDFKGRFKFDCILKRTQQISMKHANTLKLEEDFYKKNNLAFFINNLTLNLKKVIFTNKKLKVRTEVFKPRGIFQKRKTIFLDSNNQQVVEVIVDWFLINTQKHNVVRNFPKVLTDENLREYPLRTLDHIKELKNTVFLKEELASYSRCDMNFHLNHTEYISIIFDSLFLFILNKNFPKKIIIVYKKEVLIGKKMKIFIANEENLYYFYGKDNKENIFFQANVIF
ncbi:MAG: hypothetical protein LBF33_01865 [Oscillospiraceae bacterium]|nr:hypothetical protein [Oscillospiraceae bacterium]